MVKREFAKEGLCLNFVSVSRYLWAYLGPQAELEAWVKPQVEAWAHGVGILAKISQRHPQSAYAGLVMSLQSEWQYLQRTLPGVGTLMGPIEEVLIEKLFPSLCDGGSGECRRDSQGERDINSDGWSGGSEGDSSEEAEEDGGNNGRQVGSRDTLTAIYTDMFYILANIMTNCQMDASEF